MTRCDSQLTRLISSLVICKTSVLKILRLLLTRHPMMLMMARSGRAKWRALALRLRPVVFKPKAFSPLINSLAPALRHGGGRRALCVGHVLPYPPDLATSTASIAF
jgi:hypothetical protein